MQSSFQVQPVAIARTAFRQKFAIPRQAGLVNIPASIELLPPFNQAQAVAGLEQVSHIWLTFLFHQHLQQNVSLQVRPPRLGGNRKLGVFASRSSFRPNHIGQSVVKLDGISQSDKQLLLQVRGLDVLDGTPIIDIKPYLPYADSIADACNAIAAEPPAKTLEVVWPPQALQQLQQFAEHPLADIQQWITELIQYDPRPAYRGHETGSRHAMSLFNLDIHWTMQAAQQACITRIERLTSQDAT